MTGKAGQNWSPAQRGAACEELEAHIMEILQQTNRLTQEVQEKLKLVEQLTAHLAGHCDKEDALPF